MSMDSIWLSRIQNAFSRMMAGVFCRLQKMNRKTHLMPKDTVSDHCSYPTQELTIKIPCRLAKRVEAYANETGADITNVVIEVYGSERTTPIGRIQNKPLTTSLNRSLRPASLLKGGSLVPILEESARGFNWSTTNESKLITIIDLPPVSV